MFCTLQIGIHLAIILGAGKLLGFRRRDVLLASNANVGGDPLAWCFACLHQPEARTSACQNLSQNVQRTHDSILCTFLPSVILYLSSRLLTCRSDHGSGHGGSQGLAHLPHTRHPRGYALQMPLAREFIASFK